MVTRTQTHNFQYQTNGHDQLSMSTRTQARNFQYQTNGHDQLSMSTWTQACNYQRQTNGCNQLSMSTRTQACNFQYQTNGHNLQLIRFEQGHNYSWTRTWLLSCNNLGGVSISTNVFEFSMLQVKVNRRNYNFYIIIYITWLSQLCYIFTAE